MSDFAKNRQWHPTNRRETDQMNVKLIVGAVAVLIFVAGYFAGYRRVNQYRVLWVSNGKPVCILAVNEKTLNVWHAWRFVFPRDTRLTVQRMNS